MNEFVFGNFFNSNKPFKTVDICCYHIIENEERAEGEGKNKRGFSIKSETSNQIGLNEWTKRRHQHKVRDSNKANVN